MIGGGSIGLLSTIKRCVSTKLEWADRRTFFFEGAYARILCMLPYIDSVGAALLLDKLDFSPKIRSSRCFCAHISGQVACKLIATAELGL